MCVQFGTKIVYQFNNPRHSIQCFPKDFLISTHVCDFPLDPPTVLHQSISFNNYKSISMSRHESQRDPWDFFIITRTATTRTVFLSIFTDDSPKIIIIFPFRTCFENLGRSICCCFENFCRRSRCMLDGLHIMFA